MYIGPNHWPNTLLRMCVCVWVRCTHVCLSHVHPMSMVGHLPLIHTTTRSQTCISEIESDTKVNKQMCMLIFVVYQFVSPCTFNVVGFWVIRNRFLSSPSTLRFLSLPLVLFPIYNACHCYLQSFIHFICNMVFFFSYHQKYNSIQHVFEANKPREESGFVRLSCISFGSTVRPTKAKWL